MQQESQPIFVVGLADGGAFPQHERTARAAPGALPSSPAASTANTSTSTMSHQPPADLRHQALQAINDATFALNTFNPAEAAKALQKALGLAGQLVANAAGSDFAGYSLNAFLDEAAPAAGALQGEFAGYDLNNPEGKPE